MVFVGPPPEQIELMGDKVRARNFVEHGVPVDTEAVEDDDQATRRTRAPLATPLLIKASGGGGAKGDAQSAGSRADGIRNLARDRTRRSALFNDGRLDVER